MGPDEQFQKTPLYDQHLALNARMVPFGGWTMPVQYDGILKEYHQTRNAASIFDISHMGEFIISGDLGETGLDAIVTMPLADLAINACRYGCILNPHGGVIDDLIVFRLEKEKWFLVVNAATTQKDAAHFRERLKDKDAFSDISSLTGKIDLQGPLSRKVLSSFVEEIENLDYYTFDFFEVLGERVLISRTGYTGELGYEIYFPWEKISVLWEALLEDDRVKPAGLGARDVLRLEMGYSLYGHELGENISPVESGLNRFICWEKDFIGKEALLKKAGEGPRRRITGIVSTTRKAPREGNRIFTHKGEDAGIITSGTFSPALNRGIGLGFVLSDLIQPGVPVFFGDRPHQQEGRAESRIFYKGGSLKD